MPLRRLKFITLLIAFTLSSHLVAQTGTSVGESIVRHSISFPALNQQYIHVQSEFPVDGPSANIQMANWTPGSYLVRDFASDLDRISFRNPAGNPLASAKVAKSKWKIELQGATTLIVEYDVHAGDLTVNTSWVSTDYVLLNGASVFLFSEQTRDLQHEVMLSIPDSFTTVSTALSGPGKSGPYLARDFDELVDSPIVLSSSVVHLFQDGKDEYALLNVGATELWDGSRSALDLQVLVKTSNRFWGEVPFDHRYWFFNFLVEGSGGLEHDHSTVMMGSRWQMRDREDYIKWLSLAAHEYFHAWNVRRIRPQELARYEYDAEQYSGALWLAEGVTSYYDNLLLSRAGLIEPVEYLKRLAIDLHALELTPGRELISVKQASRDAWIRHYKRDSNSVNSTVSYYTKGAVLSLVLDARIRMITKRKSSLDDVMRLFFERWGQTPYPDTAFADIVEEVADAQTKAWLIPLLETPAELDVDEALSWFGLVLDRHPVNNAARLVNGPLITGFGVNWDSEKPGLVIKNVISGMNGSAAGLLPEDELLAINQERVTSENIDDRLTRLQPGTDVSLLISRKNLIMNVDLTLEEARPASYEIRLNDDFGKRELRHMESWLGQSLQTEAK